MNRDTYLRFLRTQEIDFFETTESCGAKGPGQQPLSIEGTIELPLVFPVCRPPGVQYPDHLTRSNPFLVKCYITENLNCDVILSWKTLIFLGIELNTGAAKRVVIQPDIGVQTFLSNEPTNTLQVHPQVSTQARTKQPVTPLDLAIEQRSTLWFSVS